MPAYVCSPCADKEFGKVRSVAFIHKNYLPVLMADPTDMSLWQDGIFQGLIIIIPYASGSFDPGEPVQLKGYGSRIQTNGPRTMVLSFQDGAYKSNYGFYNGLKGITQYVMAFRTSSLIHVGTKPASVFAKDPVAEDLESEVAWEVTAKWMDTDLPSIHDASNLQLLFTCSGTSEELFLMNTDGVILDNTEDTHLQNTSSIIFSLP